MKEFKDFLLKQNALALAVGVIIGGAFGKVVSSVVDNLLMPLISLALPGGNWREAKFVLASSTDATGKVVEKALGTGPFVGSVVDFVIIAWVVFMIMKIALKPEPAAPAPPTKVCAACKETVPADATRCRACTSAV